MATDQIRSSLALLYDLSRELSKSLDLHTVLEKVLTLSVQYVEAERGSLIVFNEKGQPADAILLTNSHLITQEIDKVRAVIDQGLAGWVVRNRQAVLVKDTSQDSRWLRRPDDAIDRSGAKSALLTPLVAHDQMVGVLTIVHPRPNSFAPDQLELLQSIADQAAVAVRNAQLYASVETATRRYRELFEDSIDPILITDWNGRIVEANRRAVDWLRLDKTNLAEHNITEYHNVQWERVGSCFTNLHSGQTCEYESILKISGKEPVPAEIYARTVHFENDEYIQWILRDISERKALDTLRDDLAAMIYHDLRSPLANIVSSLDMLQVLLPLDTNPTISSVFNIANRSVDRLQRLISSLLDINKLEAGQPITNLKETNLNQLISEAVNAVQSQAESKQQKLVISLTETLPGVKIDSDMIKRVLINLIENAIKYTQAEGSITVDAKCKGKFVEIGVADTGPGIPPESLEKVFDKFTRLQSDRYPKGLGLGLAFCRLAVQAHGGTIGLESELGVGSRFFFTIPIPE